MDRSVVELAAIRAHTALFEAELRQVSMRWRLCRSGGALLVDFGFRTCGSAFPASSTAEVLASNGQDDSKRWYHDLI